MKMLLDNLTKFTVAIQEAKDGGIGRILGTGIIVTDDGLILTCYHVIGNPKNKTIDIRDVDIYFPSEPDIIGHAIVLEEHSDALSDVAFLQLKEKLPDEVVVANLSESVHSGNNFRSFGFRKPTQFKGLLAEGKIRGKIINKAKDGEDSVAIQLYSDEIEPGMSGAPVLELETNRVIGIISEHWTSTGNVDTSLNFAIPVDSILKVYPDLKQKNPGLKPIFDFVSKIGMERIKKYERIDELYVPPTNYNDIKKSLEEDKLLFLTGTQEYGKTYTAIHLLWEFFNKGYEPVWFKGSEEKEERKDVRKKFANVEKYLKPNSIMYFEDPFGKTEYEVNVDEGIVRNIATIIENVENTENTYVIITSREEVFKEFRRKITAEVDLRKYEKKLGVKTLSYNYEKRKEMLVRWATIMNSKWNEDEDLKSTVFETIKDESKLPTPLNIEQFAIATAKKILDKEKILEKINAKSIETAKGFAEEIKLMSSDKILFLSFLFISEDFSAEFVKENYQNLVNELKIEDKQTAWKFDRILDWFRDDKIDVTYNAIRFSHPSYSEALPYVLVDNDGIPSNLNAKIFSKVLLKLSTLHGDAAFYVTNIIYHNFDKLPDDVREELLINLDHNEIYGVAENVSRIIANNYDKLPDRLKNLLFELADRAPLDVAYSIAYNFDKLSDKIRNMLFELADNEKTAKFTAYAVAYNYDKMPDKLKKLLFKLAGDRGADIDVAYAIARNANNLPPDVRQLLSKIAIDNGAVEDVYDAVSRNFDKLPQDNVTKELFMNLADNKATIIYAARIAAGNFSLLQANVMNELLRELVPKFLAYSNDYPLRLDLPLYIYQMLLGNFVELSNDLKQLLFELIDKKYGVLAGKEISISLMGNFEKYPYNVRNELLSKFENRFGFNNVINAIPHILDRVRQDILDELVLKFVNRALNDQQDWIFGDADLYEKLSDKTKSELLHRFVNEGRFSMEFVAHILIERSDNLSKDLVKELTLKLIKQYDNKLHLALIIIKNYEKLDYNIPTVTNTLFNLALDDSYSVSKAMLHYFDVMPVQYVRELLFKLADNKKTAKGLYDILISPKEEDPFSAPIGNIDYEISQNVSDELINELITRVNKTLT